MTWQQKFDAAFGNNFIKHETPDLVDYYSPDYVKAFIQSILDRKAREIEMEKADINDVIDMDIAGDYFDRGLNTGLNKAISILKDNHES